MQINFELLFYFKLNIIILKILKTFLGVSIILCDIFVFILIQYVKSVIFKKNRLSFYFMLITLLEVLSDFFQQTV